jgi:hypothetical protein
MGSKEMNMSRVSASTSLQRAQCQSESSGMGDIIVGFTYPERNTDTMTIATKA